jgi:tocopherol O-methyltransferase
MTSKVANVQLSAEVVAFQEGIGNMYDEISSFWEDILGEHIHQGYYDLEPPFADVRTAQFRMIDESLRFAGLSENPAKFPKSVVDVGCGLGGSSRYMAKKYDTNCHGITLSPYQVQRGTKLAVAQGLSDKVSFQVANALKQPFPDNHFDLVWTMDCGEHMPERGKFISELVRVAAPGATILIATWCHRDLAPSEKSLQPWEKQHLDKISEAYSLAEWCSVADYVKLLKPHPVENIKSDDWSKYVTPFWPQAMLASAAWNGVRSDNIHTGTKAMGWMNEGYEKNVIKFGIVTCRKATEK